MATQIKTEQTTWKSLRRPRTDCNNFDTSKISNLADGELIATVSDDKTVRLYDADTGREIHVFHETKGAGVHLDWHPGSNCLGVAFADKKVKVYDCRMLKLQQLYSSHEGPVSQVRQFRKFHLEGSFYGLIQVLFCVISSFPLCYARTIDKLWNKTEF